jgi:hypothetical protein
MVCYRSVWCLLYMGSIFFLSFFPPIDSNSMIQCHEWRATRSRSRTHSDSQSHTRHSGDELIHALTESLLLIFSSETSPNKRGFLFGIALLQPQVVPNNKCPTRFIGRGKAEGHRGECERRRGTIQNCSKLPGPPTPRRCILSLRVVAVSQHLSDARNGRPAR